MNSQQRNEEIKDLNDAGKFRDAADKSSKDGDFKNAADYYSHSLWLYQEHLHCEHPIIGKIMADIAQMLTKLNKFKDALFYQSESDYILDIYK
jgi:hypothetical protein